MFCAIVTAQNILKFGPRFGDEIHSGFLAGLSQLVVKRPRDIRNAHVRFILLLTEVFKVEGKHLK